MAGASAIKPKWARRWRVAAVMFGCAIVLGLVAILRLVAGQLLTVVVVVTLVLAFAGIGLVRSVRFEPR